MRREENREKRKGSRKKKKHTYQTKHFDRAQFMGIDWGRSDIGIALADEDTRMAFAYTTLDYAPRVVEKIGKIIQEKEVKTVVIGIPSPINRGEVVYDGEKLGELLEHNYGVVVQYQNEMFSTKVAQRQLIEKGIRDIEMYDDQEAARVILQDWLERKTLQSRM
jgi:putative transcription antitermination factor YqgF